MSFTIDREPTTYSFPELEDLLANIRLAKTFAIRAVNRKTLKNSERAIIAAKRGDVHFIDDIEAMQVWQRDRERITSGELGAIESLAEMGWFEEAPLEMVWQYTESKEPFRRWRARCALGLTGPQRSLPAPNEQLPEVTRHD
jgi:hypothetical protein